MELYIKHMVSRRCIIFVKSVLQDMGIQYDFVELGRVQTDVSLTKEQFHLFEEMLNSADLELLTDKKQILVERVKNLIVEMVHDPEGMPVSIDSGYFEENLGYDYTYLSNMFSEVKGMSIKHYIILNKIERVKDLLLYDELTLSEIAYRLQYSSVGHLSNQFKKITGLSPSGFKGSGYKREMYLEDL